MSKIATVFTTYIGRYVTKIFLSTEGVVYQCDGTELDLEGQIVLLKVKYDGFEIVDWDGYPYL